MILILDGTLMPTTIGKVYNICPWSNIYDVLGTWAGSFVLFQYRNDLFIFPALLLMVLIFSVPHLLASSVLWHCHSRGTT